MLSATAHGDHPDQKAVFEALLAALDTVDHDHARLYADVVLAELPQAARDYLEELMALKPPYEYQSDFDEYCPPVGDKDRYPVTA